MKILGHVFDLHKLQYAAILLKVAILSCRTALCISTRADSKGSFL
jgi:hypothetical protein